MRLRDGYWPRDARKLLDAWDAYRGRVSPHQSRWFLRRVDAAGLVQHAGSAWGAPTLTAYAGQTVAVSRIDAAGLLAQTLELPSKRFALARLQEV